MDEAIYSLYPDFSCEIVRHLYRRYVEADIESSLDYYFSSEAGMKWPMLALRNARYRPHPAQMEAGQRGQAEGGRRNRTRCSGRRTCTLTQPGTRLYGN